MAGQARVVVIYPQAPFFSFTVIDKGRTNHPRRLFFVHLMSFSDLYAALKNFYGGPLRKHTAAAQLSTEHTQG